MAWLWNSIQQIVGLFVNNNTEFRKLGGQAYNQHQKRVLLEMSMPSLVGLTRGPIRQECTGVLIVYDCWQQLVVTAYPCTPRQRIPQPDDDGWKLTNIIHIPKPGKDHSEPLNYRLIAPTSCVCKTMERMINARLVWFLESNRLLSNQYTVWIPSRWKHLRSSCSF